MLKTVGAFSSLFLATLLLLVGSGLFNTYVGLRLTATSVSEVWVGGIIAAYYLGLTFGARVGHKLIIRVGHIRAYAATAAVVTVTVLIQALVQVLPLWIGLRFIAGIAMVTQFIVLESWLNEQTENHLRGRVFAFYMVFSSLGTVFGQLSVGMFPALDTGPLMFVALCSAACLIPVAVTRRVHPAIQVPVPLHYRYYFSRVPMSMTVMFIAGMMSGAFYGLAPVYGVAQGMNAREVSVFVAAAVASGLVFQWPIGWLADRISRVGLIRINSVILAALTLPLWGWWPLPYPVLVVFSCLFGIILFTLYPIAAAFANDNVDPERRVGLSAILYMVYGLGACVGPLVVGFLMRGLHAGVFFVFATACAVFLIVFVRTQRVSGAFLSQDAPTGFVPMPDSVQNTNVVPALDPRVDPDTDVSFVTPTEEEIAAPSAASQAASEAAEADPPSVSSVHGVSGADYPSATSMPSGAGADEPAPSTIRPSVSETDAPKDTATSRTVSEEPLAAVVAPSVPESQAALNEPRSKRPAQNAGPTATASSTSPSAPASPSTPISMTTPSTSAPASPSTPILMTTPSTSAPASPSTPISMTTPSTSASTSASTSTAASSAASTPPAAVAPTTTSAPGTAPVATAASASGGAAAPGKGVRPSDLLAMMSSDPPAHATAPKSGIEPVVLDTDGGAGNANAKSTRSEGGGASGVGQGRRAGKAAPDAPEVPSGGINRSGI
jgi:Cyanate permease